MPIANLPPLKTGVRIPDRAGVWSAGELNLDRLADALNIDAVLEASELRSIPDAWAQVQIARQALTAQAADPPRKHSAGRAVTRQWRALLALFALQPLYRDRYELVIDSYDLPPAPKPDTPVEPRAAFAGVLATLPPTARLRSSFADWSRLGMVFARSVGTGQTPAMVGLLTPDLMVSPTRLTDGARLPGVPWFENGPLDPTEVAALNARDFFVLAKYLTQLRQFLADQAAFAADPDLNSQVLNAVEKFRARCAELAEGVQLATLDETLVTSAPLSALHAPMLKTFVIDPAKIDVTQGPCHLKLRDAVTAPFKGILLLDPAVAEIRGLAANRTVVWRHYLLSEMSDPRVLDTVREDAASEGYLAISADELFAAEFIDLEAGSKVRGHDLNGFRGALLPLSPAILLLLSPSEIRKAIGIRPGGGGERHVTLRLTLLDGTPLEMARTFAAGAAGRNAATNVVRPANLAIWPDFQHRDWPWNFLRFEHDPGSTDLQTRFGASGAQIAHDIADMSDGRQRERRARLWALASACKVEEQIIHGVLTPPVDGQPIQPLQRLRFTDLADSVAEVQISSRGFEALFFARRPDRASAPRPAGMVLLDTDAPEPRVNPTILAIDFGSTNTVAATNLDLAAGAAGGQAGHALTFQSRAHSPIEAAEEQRQREWRQEAGESQVDFFPFMTQPTPAPTVIRKRVLHGDSGMPSEEKFAADNRPLFPDSIFFLSGFDTGRRLERRISQIVLDHERPHLVFGLKWGSDKTLTRHFLQQFMIMAAAELAARGHDPSKIEWRYSYPEAMHEDDIEILRTTYRSLASTLFPVPAPATAGDPASFLRQPNRLVRVESFTESEAAAAYFLNLREDVRDFTLVLDIGGSTTDAAMWLRGDRRPFWHGSVRIAGGDFLTHYLVNNPEFLEKLGMEEINGVVRAMGRKESTLLIPPGERPPEPTLRDFAELFFSDERFDGRFRATYGAEAASGLGSGLRRAAMAGVGGLLYYFGKVLRSLIDAWPDELEARLNRPTIAFAGRGALFIKMLGGEEPAQNRRLRGLGAMLARGAGLDPQTHRPGILFSPEPKLEAVLGMRQAVRRDANDEAPLDEPKGRQLPPAVSAMQTFMPIGETLNLVGEPAVEAWASVQQLAGRESRSSSTLPQFDLFLDALAHETGLDIDIGDADSTERARAKIVNYVTGRIAIDLAAAKGVRARGTVSHDIEPVFVSALRGLLESMGQNAATRASRLSVREGS